MGYQALLFCPDEKLAHLVNQVFTDLDFAVDVVHDPFAAVKKLMSQRFDAIVVESENEQNASLLFKSARNSSSNQHSLAIALVEGQAGVAMAYRIGANLVLTKPINVEQAKGTLRVARGLLRKNSDAAAARASSTAGVAMPPETTSAGWPAGFSSNSPKTPGPARLGVEPAVAPAPTAQNRITMAPAPPVEERKPAFSGEGQSQIGSGPATTAAASIPTHNTNFGFTPVMGSAAAPAPAKVKSPPPAENRIVEAEPASAEYDEAVDTAPLPFSMPEHNSRITSDTSSFSTLDEDEKASAESGGYKQTLITAVAVLALVAVAYLGYDKLSKPEAAVPAPQSISARQDSAQPAPALSPMSSPDAAPSKTASDRTDFAPQPSAPKTAKASPPAITSAEANPTVNSKVISIAVNNAPNSELAAGKTTAAPILVKSTASVVKTKTLDDVSAPPPPAPPAMASVNDSNVSGLMSSVSSNLPKPALATLKVSQGVTQGLLIKRVTPKYPQAALAVHAGGDVQIQATINKEGTVTNPTVLSGDPVLARAALEAVRQWRYKPYYLDGAPVEIQTQITVTFKAN